MLEKLLKKLKKKAKPLYRSGTRFNDGQSVESIAWNYTSSNYTKLKKEDKRIEKKPAEIFKELMDEIPKIDMSNIREKIKMVEKRKNVLKDVIGSSDTSDEDEALNFLKAIEKLSKIKEDVKKLFPWEATTNKLIGELTKKYKLAQVDFKDYYKTVPMEAIDEIEKFAESYKKVCPLTPALLLIIDDVPDGKGGKSKERKKDPILLALSPFGKWWFILGAWDNPFVKIVDEFIYN